jgi:hypothetical protein
VVAERWIMTLADINKWISGETEAFPLQTPSAASVDSNPGEERSTAQPSIQKFVHLAIAAVIWSLRFRRFGSFCFDASPR